MAIVIDADVIIRGEKGTFDFPAWLASLPSEEFAVAAITVAELWHGVERASGKIRRTRQTYLQTVVAGLELIPYTENTALIHARLWAQLESAGTMIGYYDLIVAATALEHGHSLATFNQRHFQLVAGLNVIHPRA